MWYEPAMVRDHFTTRAPDIPEGLDWINTGRPLRLADLRGKVVLLDFWSAGCINCMHVLPRLEELERRFRDSLVVIGVHAGKYPAERRTPNLRRACDRLGVAHPVVNDRQFRTWRSYGVEAWPSIALVTPDGMLVGVQAGEFPVGDVASVIQTLVERYEAEGTLVRGKLEFGADPDRAVPQSEPLRFPGRVVARGAMLYVADSGNRRVVEARLAPAHGSVGFRHAEVLRTWGGGEGFADGSPSEARFREPQGLALVGTKLYVADRANHAVRAIDLEAGGPEAVRTVAGTGAIAEGRVLAGPATQAMLRSPWGLAAFEDTLYVAMAGSHQLWALDPPTGRLSHFAGSGAEEITDGARRRATLAQPMGICSDPLKLLFADAESSAIRSVATGPLDAVRSIVGTGLFDHGDRDGTGDAVRLQHPQDVAYQRRTLLVADTYNDKIKVIEPGPRTSAAMIGEAGSGDSLLHPSGIWADDDRVFVADTDNHRVVAIAPADGSVVPVIMV